MDNSEFFGLLFAHPFEYFFIFCLSFLLYGFVLRRFVFSLFDPLLVAFVFSAIGFATVVFVFYLDRVSFELFFQYIMTQVLFVFSFMVSFLALSDGRFFRYGHVPVHVGKDKNVFSFFLFCMVFFLFLFVLQTYLYGVPALEEFYGGSRLSNSLSGSLYSHFSRLLGTLQIVVLCLSLYVLWFCSLSANKKLIVFFGLFLLVLYGLSGGSKSFLISLVGVAYLFSFFFYGSYRSPLEKRLYKLIPFVVVSVIAVIYTKSDSPFFYFLYRLLISGDVYYMAYPDEVYRSVDELNWFVATFNGVLKNLRLIGPESYLDPMGYQLYRNFYALEDIGPNPRHNVFGLVYYGYYGSFIYSAVLGGVLGSARALLVKAKSSSVYVGVFVILVSVAALKLETDVAMAITAFLNAFVVYPVIVFLYFCLVLFFRHAKK